MSDNDVSKDQPAQGIPVESDKWQFQAPGQIDKAREGRAEAVLGTWSYYLLASRAYRFAYSRTRLLECLARELQYCLGGTHDASFFIRAQVLMWGLHAHLFMHLEDLAGLIHATGKFGLQWEKDATAGDDLIVREYLAFGDPERGKSHSIFSALNKVGRSKGHVNMLRALWLPRKKEWLTLRPDRTEAEWVHIKKTADYCRGLVRRMCEVIESEDGRAWYGMYLRYKHGAPLIALDLFHADAVLQYAQPVGPNTVKSAVPEVVDRLRNMHLLLPHHPHGKQLGGGKPVLWSFPCTTEIANQTVKSSRLVSWLEGYVCTCIVRRAESEGARDLLLLGPR